ncbi:MAG TPA: glycosyltransferase family 4 protein [Candidatus Krumholzibacteria bacterium]|nr:glycosyltransferase family 4 protein [Candidatus Krumholzibacteria bacterium]
MNTTAANTRGTIAIVRHSYYPSELNVKREAEALRDAGFAVHVICLRGRDEAKREDVEGVNVHRLPIGHERGKILRYLWEYNAFFVLAAIRLTRLHRRLRLVAVQVNTMPDYLVFTALFPKMTGARVVLHLHEPVPELFRTMFHDRWYTRWFVALTKLAEKMAIGFADRALTVTEQMKQNYVARGADPGRITVIVNVPDDRHFRLENYAHLAQQIADLKAEDRAAGRFRVLTHGAIEKRYGFDLIVRAAARVREEIPGIEFRYMGSGGYKADVRRIAEMVSMQDRVHHLGFVPFEEMVLEILLADVCIVAVQKNPYSVLVHTNKMFEYIALQRPLIVSRLDSVAAYFPDDTLLYFEPGSDESLAAAIRHAHANPQEMQRRVAAASGIYEAFRWENERRKYLSVYDGIHRT